MAAAGLKIADKKGKLDGPSIKAALETLKDWSPFDTPNALGRSHYTITDKDHRPTPVVDSLCDQETARSSSMNAINMKEKFPDKWQSWLGW